MKKTASTSKYLLNRLAGLPSEWIGAWVHPALVSPADDPRKVIAEAIDQPVGSLPLDELVRPGQRVVLLVDDGTRPTPARLILSNLLGKLSNLGVADGQISIVIALGTHRPMTSAELADKLGAAVASRFCIVQSSSAALDEMVYLGQSANGIPGWVHRTVVEADLRIGIGMITPHMDAGFSGGAKILLPGVCGVKTVDAFHAHVVDHPENPLGNMNAPLRLALEQFVQEHVPLDFIVNLVLTPQGEVYRCVAGDAVAAQRKGAELAQEVFGAPVSQRHPVVVANCAPYQRDLWQSCKGLWCGDLITEDDGTLIWATQAPEASAGYPRLPAYIGGDPNQLKARLQTGEQADLAELATAVMIGYKKKRMRIVLVSEGFTPADAILMGLPYCSTIEAAVVDAVERLAPDTRAGCVAIIPQAGFVLPYFTSAGN